MMRFFYKKCEEEEYLKLFPEREAKFINSTTEEKLPGGEDEIYLKELVSNPVIHAPMEETCKIK